MLSFKNNKTPQVGICDWRDDEDTQQVPTVPDDQNFRNDKDHPLVYHLFGSLSQKSSLVLSEDDYFEHLLAVRQRNLLPAPLRTQLCKSALLFVGFQIEDWDFRVLLRMITTLECRRKLAKNVHVAVQIDPVEGRFVDPDHVRKYLEDYFFKLNVPLSIYWGPAERFLEELTELLK